MSSNILAVGQAPQGVKGMSSAEKISNDRLTELLAEHSGYAPDAFVPPSTLRMGALESLLREQLALRDLADSHVRCDAEISRLTTALMSIYDMRCLHKEPLGCSCPVCIAKRALGIEDV